MNMHKKIWKNAAACLLAALMFPGCSDDEGGGTTPTGDGLATLVVTLQAENSSEPVGTRAAGDPTETEEEENDYERQIEHWWVLIYNNEGFVDYLSDTKGSTATTPEDDDSRFSTSIELPVGTYRLYGFANLGNLNETDLITNLQNGSIDEDDLVANRNTLAGQAVDLGNVLTKFNVSSDIRPTIPMSAYVKDITLSEDEQNSVTLGLYRMIGKVRVTVTNQTGKLINMGDLSMGNFRTSGTNFLMPYDGLDKVGQDIEMAESMQPIFPNGNTGNTYNKYKYPLGADKQIADQTDKTYTFYVPETPREGQATNGTSPMIISFKIPEKGTEAMDRPTTFDFVRRNDLLDIPVTISNIDDKLTYKNLNMPIGGIPETVITESNDGVHLNIPYSVVASRSGWLEIEYSLKTVNSIQPANIKIRYKNTTVTGGREYSEAFLTDNTDELIIDAEKGTPISNEPDYEIKLTPTGATEVINDDLYGGASGTLTVYTQELGNNSEATITMQLVATYTSNGSTNEVIIPYTITIQNYSNETQP